MKNPLILVSFFGGLFGFVLSGNAATSDIPERREFPVNPGISPCQNFYEHACSKVNTSFKLREDRSRHVFAFSDSHERILEKKKKFLAELQDKNPKKLSRRAITLRNVYGACVNVEASKKEERTLVKERVAAFFDLVDRERFHQFLEKKIDSPDTGFLSFGDIPNQDRPNWNDLYLHANLQTLPERSYYDRKEVVEDFRGIVRSFFETLKIDRAKDRANWVVDFETRFTKTYPLPAEWRKIVNERRIISRSQIQKKYPRFELARFLKRIPKKARIRNFTPENFEFLNKALGEEPMDVLKSVWLFHAATPYMDDAYPDFYKKWFDFNHKHLGGPKERPERKERCTKMVMRKFGKEIDAELLPVLFPKFPEKRFRKLVERVRVAIIDGLKNNSWLQPKTKQAAIRKIKAADLQVVKPRNNREWYFNPPAKYSLDRPYENARILSQKLIDRELKELSQKRDPKRWHMGPLTVNAYYVRSDNKFVLPIGILQFPFYDPSLPDEVNLGAVGAVIGHELGHGIDDEGSKYDHQGKLRTWFTKRDLKTFQEKGKAFVQQFDKIGHNGKLTLGENIGDFVGVTFAYRAAFPQLKTDVGDAKKKARLEQMKKFFLQYARLWCTVARPKFQQTLLKTSPHSLGYARVNEQVKHQIGFREAFGCQKNDPMTLPEDQRLDIW